MAFPGAFYQLPPAPPPPNPPPPNPPKPPPPNPPPPNPPPPNPPERPLPADERIEPSKSKSSALGPLLLPPPRLVVPPPFFEIIETTNTITKNRTAIAGKIEPSAPLVY